MKPWYQSKTLWVNVATLAVAVLTAVTQSALIADYPEIVAGIVSAISALNIALRWLTDKPITSPVTMADGLRPRILDNNTANRYMAR